MEEAKRARRSGCGGWIVCVDVNEKVMTQIADEMADTGWRNCSCIGGSTERTEGTGSSDEEAE